MFLGAELKDGVEGDRLTPENLRLYSGIAVQQCGGGLLIRGIHNEDAPQSFGVEHLAGECELPLVDELFQVRGVLAGDTALVVAHVLKGEVFAHRLEAEQELADNRSRLRQGGRRYQDRQEKCSKHTSEYPETSGVEIDVPLPRYNRQRMDVYEELVRLRNLGQKCALATIVEVRGSIPSYETAKLLVREDGSMTGTIGGGCVEAEVWNAAREVIETEKPKHLTFNLGQDAAYDNGLICGGQLDVFVEPVLPIPHAFIFGAGHISKSLAKVATLAGFATVVIDNREIVRQPRTLP